MEYKSYPKDNRFQVFQDGTIIGIKGKPLVGSYDKSGYRHVMLGNKTNEKVCRVVALTHVHNPRPDIYNCVNHINGIKSDDRAVNLEWCNHAENMAHASRTGLFSNASGSKHYLSKLDETQVKVIKDCFTQGYNNNQIAKYFRVQRATIWSIRNGKSWASVW